MRSIFSKKQTIGHSLMNGLIDYWPLNEPSDIRIGLHSKIKLTVVGTGVTTVTGIDGNLASSFPSPSYLSQNLTGTIGALGDTDFTFSAWVRTPVIDSSPVVLSSPNPSATNQYGVQIQTTRGTSITRNRIYLRIGTNPSVSAFADIEFRPNNDWLFIMGWHDSLNNILGSRIMDTEGTISYSGGGNPGNFPLVVGVAPGADNRPCDVARLGFWRRILTNDERNWLYNNGMGRSYPFL